MNIYYLTTGCAEDTDILVFEGPQQNLGFFSREYFPKSDNPKLLGFFSPKSDNPKLWGFFFPENISPKSDNPELLTESGILFRENISPDPITPIFLS